MVLRVLILFPNDRIVSPTTFPAKVDIVDDRCALRGAPFTGE
jgi:hypothetical protein